MSTDVRSDPEAVNRGSTGIPMPAEEPPRTDGGPRGSRPSLGELMSRITAGLKMLARQEVELARIETAQAASERAKGAGALGAAGVIGLFAMGFTAAAVAAAIAIVLPLWAALLIVGGGFGLVAIVALAVGMHYVRKTPISAVRTRSTLKENLRWAKAQIRR